MDIESKPRVLILISNRQIRENLERANAGLEGGGVDLVFAEDWNRDADEIEFLLLAEDFNESAAVRSGDGLPNHLRGIPTVFVSDESISLIRRFCREQEIPAGQVRTVLKPEYRRLAETLAIVRDGVITERLAALENGEAIEIEGGLTKEHAWRGVPAVIRW